MRTIVVIGYMDSVGLYKHMFTDLNTVTFFSWRNNRTVRNEFRAFMDKYTKNGPFKLLAHSMGALIALEYLCSTSTNTCEECIFINPFLDPCIYNLYKPIRKVSEFLIKKVLPGFFPLKLKRRKNVSNHKKSRELIFNDKQFEYTKNSYVTVRETKPLVQMFYNLTSRIHHIEPGIVKIYQSIDDHLVNKTNNLHMLRPVLNKIEYHIIPGSHRVFNEMHIWDNIKERVLFR
jgi:hypothetical protein